MAQISIPKRDEIERAIKFTGTALELRNFSNQSTPIKVYFMPADPGFKPYTAAQVANTPSLAAINASYISINPAARQNIMTNVFGVWAKQANISFVETTDPAQAQIRVGAGNGQGNASVNVPGFSGDGRINSVFLRTDFYSDSPFNFEVNRRATNDLTAEIKTGRRRVIEYLLSPIQRATSESLRER